VEPGVLAELGDQPLHDGIVDVVTTQVRVTIRRNDLYDVVTDFEDRNVERAATEVVHGDDLVVFLVEAIRQGSCRGLADDTLHVGPGDFACVFRGLTLDRQSTRLNSSHVAVSY